MNPSESSNQLTKISKDVFKELKYYVYAYCDDKENVFYIGKGVGNRALVHWLESSKSHNSQENRMLKKLRELRESKKEPSIYILRYNLTSDEAFLLESVLISIFQGNLIKGLKLVNQKAGRDSKLNLISLKEFDRRFSKGDAIFKDKKGDYNCLLVPITRSYKENMDRSDLYDATRVSWKIGKNRDLNKIKYVMPIYDGIIMDVYEATKWFPAGSTMRKNDFDSDKKEKHPKDRYEFVGRLASNKLLKKYKGKSCPIFFRKHAFCYI